MLLSKIPTDKREEGALATLRAEGQEWATKLVKVGGKNVSKLKQDTINVQNPWL